jgi:hypothetical protein
VIGKYLAAQYLLRQLTEPRTSDKVENVARLGFDVRWQEVLMFVIEEVDERHDLNGLLRVLIDRRRKANRSVAESLVATALATKSRLVDPEIRNRFTDIKISQERLDTGSNELLDADADGEAEPALGAV